MRLSFITDEATQDPSRFIALAQQFEVEAVELRTVLGRSVWELTADELAALRASLQAAGLGVCCIGSSVFKSDFRLGYQPELHKLRAVLDAASELACPLVRVFSFWRSPERAAVMENVVEALAAAGEMARTRGVLLAIENGKRTMHATGVELAELLDGLVPGPFGALWDPGNAVFGGLDDAPLDNGYPPLARRILHVHIKDPLVYRDGDRRYVPLGAGQLDLARQLQLLHHDGFSGFVSLETHWRPDRILSETGLDYPGGHDFSAGGEEATAQGLAHLRDLLELCALAGGQS